MSTPATVPHATPRYLRWAAVGVMLFAMLQMLGLVLGFYSLGERVRHNHMLNAAGAQRMLTQQMARLVYEMEMDLENPSAHGLPADQAARQLEHAMRSFQANLDAMIAGGVLTDPEGDEVTVPGMSQPGVAMAARERWQIWSRSLESLLRGPVELARVQRAAMQTREHSGPLLGLMIQLTREVEDEQAQALLRLRNLLVTGLAAAGVVFAALMGSVLRQVRRADAAQHRALEEVSRTAAENTLLRRVAEHTTNPVMVTDAQRRIEWVNASFERTTGYSLAQARGHKPGELLHGRDTDPAAVARLRAAMAAGEPISGVELLHYPKNGTPYWVEVEIQPLVGSDGQVERFISIQTVVTERRAARVRLEAALAEADRSNTAKNLFLARVSHELRTPLNAMFGFAEMLWREADQLTPRQRDFAKHIVGAGRHVLDLIGDIHDLSLIEADQLKLQQGPVDLAALVHDVAQEMRPVLAEHQVSIEATAPGTEAETAVVVYVQADRVRLKEVLINLVSNATKYNRPGGWVRLDISTTPTEACVRVADTGGGMTAQQCEALFQPFNRLGAEHSEVRGSGIGLAISHRLVLAMGGRIDVRSELGVGTTMSVTLQRLSQVPVVGEPPPALAVVDAPVEGLVMYIEDNAVNMEIFAAVLETLPGVRLTRATDGASGLRAVQDEVPDLVVIDKNLPDMDGAEVMARLRAQPRLSATRIVMYSADATQASIDLALGIGFDDYWIKPMPVDALRAGLRGMLSRAAAQRRRRASSQHR